MRETWRVLRKNTKLELLRGVPLFADLSKRELESVAAVADELDLPAGRELTREGARGAEFVVIADGAAEVRQGGRRINTLSSGDFLGEIALVTGAPRTATVKTTAPSRLLVLTSTQFRKLLRDMPSLQLKVLDALARRLPPEAG
jgi:CRP/FNR family cyclic AMP-dependent transcriptional regulator